MRGTFVRVTTCAALLGVASCNRSLDVPEPPGAPGPGTVQGTVVYVEPGSDVEKPAVGAFIELLGTSVHTDVDESNGHFTLGPITARRGNVLIRFDQNHDGRAEYQLLLALEEIKAGPGRDVALGTIQLGGNATLSGAVALSDALGATSGLGGTSVFVPEGPFITYTGDNGSYRLDQLPEGRITVTFFRQGYEPGSVQVELAPNQVFQHETVVLRRAVFGGLTRVTGTVSLQDSTDASGVLVSVSGSGLTATSNAAGMWELSGIPSGLYTFGFSKPGYETAVKYNVLVQGELAVVPHVALVKGESMQPVLDAGVPPDAGNPNTGGGAGGGSGTAGGGAAGGATAGGGAAGGATAGGGAAGGATAGGGAAGGATAGGGTAGGGTAGGGTAGGGTAGGGTAGGGTAGGAAGPVALIGALPSFALRNTMVTFDGTPSTGTRPFIYHWTQDAGLPVNVPSNHTFSAASPTVTMPNAQTLLKMALTVTDINGVDSAPREFVLPVVSGPPTAAINPKPPMTVYAGQVITVGSTGSVDVNGAGLTGFEWSVLPSAAGVLVEPQGDGGTCRLTMPMTVPTNVGVQVSLAVTDGLGIRSTNNPMETFVLSSASAPTWYLDAGALAVVPGGQLASLSAVATPPQPGPTFSYQWSPGFIPDAGGYTFTVINPNAANTQFATPIIQGPNVQLLFDVTATVTSGGLTPLQRTARQVVIVADQTQPTPAGTSVASDFTGSPFGAWVDFDEDLSPTGGSPSAVVNSPPTFNLGLRPWVQVTPRRWRVTFHSFGLEGSGVRLQTGTVHDLSSFNNQAFSQTVLYTTHYLFPAPALVPLDSTTEPAPVIVPVARPAGEAAVYLVSQRNGTAVFQQLMDLNCTTGCSVTQDMTAPTVNLTTGKRRFQAPYVIAGGIPYVLLQAADFVGNTGVAVARKAGGWVQIASPPGSLFASPTTLYSAFIDTGSVKVSQYDAMLDVWGAPVTVATNATDFPSTPGSNAGVWGVGTANGTLLLAALTNAGLGRAYQNTTGTWSSTTALFPSQAADPYLHLKVIRAGDEPTDTTALLATTQATGGFILSAFGNGGSGTSGSVPGVSAFDALTEGQGTSQQQWIASIEAGQLLIRSRSSNWSVMPGPNAGNSWNFSAACTAASPALIRQFEHLAVAWQERCGTNPWKTYVRWVR